MFKKSKKTLTISILALVLVFIIGGVAYAVTYKTITTEHEMLNTGVVFIWADGNGNWQNGLKPNGSCNRSFSVNIGANMKVVKVSAYNCANFSFGKDDISHWNKTKMCKGKSSFDTNYIPYSVNGGSLSFKYNEKSGNLTVTQRVSLSSSQTFDVADKVRKGNQQEVYDYLGKDIPSGITEPMNKMLTDPSVQGYLYFCPVVINYKEVRTEVVEEPLELKAVLDLPEKGETNTPYPVKDMTQIPKGGTFQSSKLEKSVDGGKTYTLVNDWDSHAQNAEMEDENSLAITIKYRLTVYLKSGESSTDEKTIVLEEHDPEVSVKCDIKLNIKGSENWGDEKHFTYEGHPAMLYDDSVFYVTDEEGNTIKLSAEEAYAKSIARNKFTFDTPSSDVSMKSFNKVEKEATWQHRGTKTVTLTVTLKDGVTLSDVVELKM
nr:hypothetical protein [uncultured Aminipila sp.]